MGYRVTEEYQPQYRQVRPYMQTGPLPGDRFDKIRQQIAEEGRVRAQGLQDLVEKPIEAWQKASDRALQRGATEEAIETQRAQRQLSGLQQRKAQQDLALAEEFGRAEREASLASTREQMEASRVQRALAEEQADIMREELPTGRTVMQEQILAPIEASQRSAQLAERQMNIAERNAVAQAENLRLQRKVTQLGIDEQERAARVRGFQAQIAAETDPQQRAALIDNLKELGTADEIGQAVSNLKAGELQNEMMRRLMIQSDPVEQNRLQRSVEAQRASQVANSVTQELDQAIADLSSAAPDSSEAQSAALRIAQILERYGYTTEAESMGSKWDFELGNVLQGKNPVQSRTQIAKEARAKLYRRIAADIEAQYGDFSSQKQFADQLRRKSLNMGEQMSTGNLFQAQGGNAIPTVPGIYNPIAPQPGQQIQPAQTPQFERAPDGSIRLKQPNQQAAQSQPGMLTPQMLDILKQGRQRTQVGGR